MELKDLKFTPMQIVVFVFGLLLVVLASSWLTLIAFSTLFFEVPVTLGTVCSLAWLQIVIGSTIRGLR